LSQWENFVKARSLAAERNRQPILEVLTQELPEEGRILELASGAGQHALYFALHLPTLYWQPSDCDSDALASISAWREQAALDNLEAPIQLDVLSEAWPVSRVDGVVAINLLHIAPLAAVDGVFRGAATVLEDGAPVILYGPFRIPGQELARSNEAFERYLVSLSDEYKIRSLEDMRVTAKGYGFMNTKVYEMPANNHCIVFKRLVT